MIRQYFCFAIICSLNIQIKTRFSVIKEKSTAYFFALSKTPNELSQLSRIIDKHYSIAEITHL